MLLAVPHSRSRRVLLSALAVLALVLGDSVRVARADPATFNAGVRGSAQSAARWAAITAGEDLPDEYFWGPIATGPLTLVAAHLGHVPLATVETADARPARNELFAGLLTKLPQFRNLAGQRPRGWTSGTWDTVSGAGGGAPGGGMTVNPVAEVTHQGEGAASLSLHEYGHVVDNVLGSPSASDPWKAGRGPN